MHMKKMIFKTIMLFSLMMFVTSCEDNTLKQPVFDVKVDDSQVSSMIEDTIVCQKNSFLRFIISGDPDMITFFSGHFGSEYQYRNRTEIDGEPSFSFQTNLTYGTVFDGLKVYTSSTFPGISRNDSVDRVNISNMEYWEEITSQCNLPVTKTAPNNSTTSPSIDLTSFKGKPFYLAFRLVHPKGGEGTWKLSNLRIINKYNSIESVVGTFGSIGLTAFDMNATFDPYLDDAGKTDKTNKRWDFSKAADNLIAVGGSTGNATDNDDWAISNAINLTKATPDKGVGIKGYDNAPLTEYEFAYTDPGVYTVTFIGVNSVGKETAETVRNLIIKIID